MGARIDLAESIGCNGIDPDNTDCFANDECRLKIPSKPTYE